MIALIQAGGAGSRLKNISNGLPKPMVSIAGKPILQYQIENLVNSGFSRAYIVVPSFSTAIQDYFGYGSKFGIKISYIKEEEPLGTAGALYFAAKEFDEDFALLFGDLICNVDWQRFRNFFLEKRPTIASFVHPNSHPYDSDIISVDKDDKILEIFPKGIERDFYYKNLTNAGLYFVSKKVLERFRSQEGPLKLDFEKTVLSELIKKGQAYAYISSEYVKDCGTPERFYLVEQDIKNGIVEQRNLSHKQKAIFLDRDGTINLFRKDQYVLKPEMLDLQPDACSAIKKINQSPYLAICITNQPVIARGEVTYEGLDQIHNRMAVLLGQGSAYLNDLYFCPHYPKSGFAGEIPELKIECDCRKPKIGMLLKAQEKYNIDLSASWFVGDTYRDVKTGINGGCKTALITCGDPDPAKYYGDVVPTLICSNLEEAIDKILSYEE